MKIATIISLMLFPLTLLAQTYQLKGIVAGFMQWKQESKCYVAIKDPASQYYNLGYHYVDDRVLCAMAGAAFLTGTKVWATAEVRNSGTTNEIRTIEMLRDGPLPHWPPYGTRDPAPASK